MQTKEQIPKPVKFITIVNNSGSKNSLYSNNNTVDFEDKDQISTDTGLLSMSDDNELDDVFNYYFDNPDEISEGCTSNDDMISFGSAFNSASSLTSEDDDEHVDTISAFSASLPADSFAADDIMPSSKPIFREQKMRPRTPSSGVYPYVGPYVRQYKDSTSSSTASLTLTAPSTSLNSDFTGASFSQAESQSSALTFANQALERSHIRRMGYAASCNDLFTLPSSLLCRPNSAGHSVPDACASTTASSTDNSQKQSSTSQSYISHLSSSITSNVLAKISETVKANIAMLEDYDHSPRAGRVQGIKRQMRSMEIQYYRSKCVRSLRISMTRYMKIEAADDSSSTASDSSSTRSFTSETVRIENKIRVDEVKPAANPHSAMEIARDILCFNLVLAMAYMIFVLYKDTITHAIRGLDTTNLVTVAN